MNDNTDKVPTTREILITIWELAWPSILLFLSITLAFFLSFRIVSPLGTDALAGITSGQRVYFLISSVIMGLGTGATAMIAREWGRGDVQEASRYTRLTMVIGACLGLLIALLFNEIAPLVSTFFKLEGGSHQRATDYVRMLTHFSPFLAFFLLMGVALRAISDAKTPLVVTAVSNVALLLLALCLTHGYAGFPALGLRGAAIGAGFAYLLGALLYIVVWRNPRCPLDPSVEKFWSAVRIRRLFRVATPGMMEQFLLQLSLIGYMWVVGRYSTEAFVAYGIGLSVFGVTLVCGIGFSVAGAALVGQQLGAKNLSLARAYAHNTLHISLVFMLAAGVLLFLLADPIARFLSDDPEVIGLTKFVLRMMAFAQPLLAFEFAVGGALRGAGDTRFTLFTTLLCYVVVRVLIAYIFLKLGLSIYWIYSVLLFDYSIKSALLYWRLRSGRWLYILEENEHQIPLTTSPNPEP